MKNLFLFSVASVVFTIAVSVTSTPAQALTLPFLAPSLGKVGSIKKTQKSTQPTAALSFTLKPRQFSVVVKNVKSVAYTIEYIRAGGITEGLTGGGKAKSGTYVGRHFAGTQSTKYFIPHDVRSGTLTLKGQDLKGSEYNYSTKFTVNKGRLVLSR